MNLSLRIRTLKGTFWSGIERFSTQGVVLAVTLIMARRLGPSAFGLVTMAMVFADVAQGLMESGFPQALVRKTARTHADNCTAFYFNLTIGIILYGVMCMCAHPIALLYDQPELVRIVPMVGLVLPLKAVAVLQKVQLTAALDFRTQTWTSLAGALAGGITGVVMAYTGYGVMAIVWFNIIKAGVESLSLWMAGGWRPSALFSMASFRELFGFGSRLAAAGLINTLYTNATRLLVGYFFHPVSLGIFGRAQQFATLPSLNITLIVQRVSYPALCAIGEGGRRLAAAYVRFLRLCVFLVFPVMAVLFALASPLVRLLLGPEWMQCVPLIRILCLALMWYPVHALNLNLLQVVGRSDLYLRLEVIKKVAGVIMLVVCIPFGLQAICWGMVASSLFDLAVNTRYSGKLSGFGLMSQIRAFIPSLCYSVALCAVMLLMQWVLPIMWLKLTVPFVLSIPLYWLMARCGRSPELSELASLIRESRTARNADAHNNHND